MRWRVGTIRTGMKVEGEMCGVTKVEKIGEAIVKGRLEEKKREEMMAFFLDDFDAIFLGKKFSVRQFDIFISILKKRHSLK